MSAGLATLADEGLSLAALDAPADTVEPLHWHVASLPPDADTTVLLWVYKGEGDYDFECGWWDGTAWRLCVSGGLCPHMVTHWSQPEGPVL